jgi:hypothetical protein
LVTNLIVLSVLEQRFVHVACTGIGPSAFAFPAYGAESTQEDSTQSTQRKQQTGFHFVGDADGAGLVADRLSCGTFIFQGQNNAARATTTTQSQSRSLPVCLIGSTKTIMSPNIQANQGKLGDHRVFGT